MVDVAQERQTENVSTQNTRIARIEESCHNVERQSREDLAQVRAKCSEFDARVRGLAQNVPVPRGETGLPG